MENKVNNDNKGNKDIGERIVVLETLYHVLSDRQREDRAASTLLSTSLTGKMDALGSKLDDLVKKVYTTVGVTVVIQAIVLGAVAVAVRGAIL